MGLSKIEVVFRNEESIGIKLGRVPLVEEKIEIEGEEYTVMKLIHLPATTDDSYVAIVHVGTGSKGSNAPPPVAFSIV